MQRRLESVQPFYNPEGYKITRIEEEGRLLNLQSTDYSPFVVPSRAPLAHVLHLRWDQAEMDGWADTLLGKPTLSDLRLRVDCAVKLPVFFKYKRLPTDIRFLYSNTVSSRLERLFALPEINTDEPPKLLEQLELHEEDDSFVTGGGPPVTVYDPSTQLNHPDPGNENEEVDESVYLPLNPVPKFVFEAEKPKTLDDIFEGVPTPRTGRSTGQATPRAFQFDSPVSDVVPPSDLDNPSTTLDELDLGGMEEQHHMKSLFPPSQSVALQSPFSQSPASSRHTSPQSDLEGSSPTHKKRSPLSSTETDSPTNSPQPRTGSESSGRSVSISPDSPVSSIRPLHPAVAAFESDWSLLATAYPLLNASWKTLLHTVVRSFAMADHLHLLDSMLETLSIKTLRGTVHGTLRAGTAGTIIEHRVRFQEAPPLPEHHRLCLQLPEHSLCPSRHPNSTHHSLHR